MTRSNNGTHKEERNKLRRRAETYGSSVVVICLARLRVVCFVVYGLCMETGPSREAPVRAQSPWRAGRLSVRGEELNWVRRDWVM